MNVAPGVGANDAVTLAQLQAAMAAAASGVAASTAGLSAAPEPPTISVHAARSSDVGNGGDDIRRELAELRELVKQQQALLERQQQRIAQLESRGVGIAAVK